MYLTASFADRGVPKTGLTPTITVVKVSDGTILVNAAAMAEVGQGAYRYDYVGYDRAVPIYFKCDGGVALADPDRYTYGWNRDDLDRIVNGLTTQEKANVNSECTTATAPIKAKTDNLPADPADESNVLAAISGVDSKATAIQAKTDNLPIDPADQSDIIGAIAAVDNKILGLETITSAIQGDTNAIQAKTDLLQFDGLNNIQARINDAGLIDAAYIASAVWNALVADYATFDTMGNEQSKLSIQTLWVPDFEEFDVEFEPYGPTIFELHYRALSGDPDDTLTLAYLYGGFATYLILRMRAGIVTLYASGPFTDIADDMTWGVRASFEIDDYLAGDTYYFQASNIAWYIKDRFYFMGNMSKAVRIAPESTLAEIKAQTDKMQFDGLNNIQSRINDAGVIDAQLSAIGPALARVLGLTHENVYTTNTFDLNNKHTGSIVELYDSKVNANLHDGVTGLIAKYTLNVTYTLQLPTSYIMVKE